MLKLVVVRSAHGLAGLVPVRAVMAGAVVGAAIFSTRLIGDDLAVHLFRLSHGG